MKNNYSIEKLLKSALKGKRAVTQALIVAVSIAGFSVLAEGANTKVVEKIVIKNGKESEEETFKSPEITPNEKLGTNTITAKKLAEYINKYSPVVNSKKPITPEILLANPLVAKTQKKPTADTPMSEELAVELANQYNINMKVVVKETINYKMRVIHVVTAPTLEQIAKDINKYGYPDVKPTALLKEKTYIDKKINKVSDSPDLDTTNLVTRKYWIRYERVGAFALWPWLVGAGTAGGIYALLAENDNNNDVSNDTDVKKPDNDKGTPYIPAEYTLIGLPSEGTSNPTLPQDPNNPALVPPGGTSSNGTPSDGNSGSGLPPTVIKDNLMDIHVADNPQYYIDQGFESYTSIGIKVDSTSPIERSVNTLRNIWVHNDGIGMLASETGMNAEIGGGKAIVMLNTTTDNAVGMKAVDGSSIKLQRSGLIVVNGKGTGMYGAANSTVNNDGYIEVNYKGTDTLTTPFSVGTRATTNFNGNTRGITIAGDNVTFSNKGKGIGVYLGTGIAAINAGTNLDVKDLGYVYIEGSTMNAVGYEGISSGKITNSAGTTIVAKAGTAMKASNGGFVNNDGTISLTTGLGMWSTGVNSIATNNSVINSTTSTKNAMFSEAGGEILNTGTFGGVYTNALMYTKGIGSKATNTVDITSNLTGTSSAPVIIKVETGATGTNSAVLTGTSLAMKATGVSGTTQSTINNTGDITTTNAYGMYAEAGASAINAGTVGSGTISNTDSAMYGTGDGTTLLNSSSIINNTTAGENAGMKVVTKATATNEGTIGGASKYGMYADNATIINKDAITISGETGMIAMGGATAINETTGTFSTNVTDAFMVGVGVGTTAINKGIISSDTIIDGMLIADDGAMVINEGTATGSKVAMISTGINGTTQSTISNKGTIATTNAYGMYSNNGGASINSGSIGSATASNGFSMYGEDAGTTLVNNTSGKIINNSTGSLAAGMRVLGGATAVNSGEIEAAFYGMSGQNHTGSSETAPTILNAGKITMTTTNGAGMQVNGNGTAVNTGTNTNGIFGVATGMRAYSTGATAINKGLIDTTGLYGMYAVAKGTIINEIGGSFGTGITNALMYGTDIGTTLINKGDLDNNSSATSLSVANGASVQNSKKLSGSGLAMQASGVSGTTASSILNKGTIETTNAKAMYAEAGALATNDSIITILSGAATGNGGMLGIGAGTVITNNGTITTANVDGVGMGVDTNATAINTNQITATLYGMSGEGDTTSNGTTSNTLLNKGTITVNNTTNTNATGMYIYDNGYALNDTNGLINGTGAQGMNINGAAAFGVNNGTISNSGDYGVYARRGGTITNNKIISSTGKYGMYADGASTITNSLTGTFGTGITEALLAGSGALTTIVNNGIITNNAVKVLMLAKDGATATNNNALTTSSGIVMEANGDGALVTNDGTITITTAVGTGMEATGTGATTTATAINRGRIEILGPGIGMNGALTGATITNDVSGIINLSGDGAIGFELTANGVNATNSGTITLAHAGAFGIAVSGAGVDYTFNSGAITGDRGTAYLADNSGTVSNGGTITLTGNGNGMASRNGGTAINSNNIEVANGYGMTAINGTSAGSSINKLNVNVTGTGLGMYATGNGTVTNEGTITVTNATTTGLKVESGGTATNKGTVSGATSYALHAISGGTIINETGGTYTGQTNSLLYGTNSGSTVMNKGTLDNSLALTGAMLYVDGQATANNTSTGNITGTALAMKGTGQGTTLTNYGTIATTNDYAMYVTDKATATNFKSVNNTGKYGIYGDLGATITNEAGGTFSNQTEAFMYGTGSGTILLNKGTVGNATDSLTKAIMYVEGQATATNNGTLTGTALAMKSSGSGSTITNSSGATISTTGNWGMYGELSSTVVNSGTISNVGNYGIYVDGATATNNDTVSNTGSYGIYSKGGTITNNGTVSNTSNYGIYANGGSATNEKEAFVSNGGDYGMFATNGTTLVNNGTIDNKGMYGMYSIGGGDIINNGTISNSKDYGIWIKDSTATATNNGTISNKGTNGMRSDGTTKAINSSGATISNSGANGMYATTGGTITNNGTISSGSYGMNVLNKGTAINNNVINTTQFGMYITGSGGTQAVNNGTITITGDGGYGMYATNGGTLINETGATIDLSGAINTAGMHGDGGATVINRGKIILAIGDEYIGADAATGIGTGPGADGVVGKVNATNGNKTIELDDLSTFTNVGTLLMRGTLNIEDMGGGKFEVAGGTIEADAIKGDMYASGALAMASFENDYTTYRMLKTNKIEGKIISNSAMFDARLTEKDSYGYYDIRMYRKNFNDIIENKSIANVLEKNYFGNSSSQNNKAGLNPFNAKLDYYDALKLLSTSTLLNNAVTNSYGGTLYPVTLSQTQKLIEQNSTTLWNNLREKTDEDVRVIAYGDVSEISRDKEGYVAGYDTTYTTGTLGFDKKVSDKLRAGVTFTYGKTKTDYDLSSGKREDDVYQLNGNASYDLNNDVTVEANVFGGLTRGTIKRDLAFSSIYENLEGDINNTFYGVSIGANKMFTLGNYNLIPNAGMTLTQIVQDEIQETGGDYALKVDKQEFTSTKPNVGVAFNRTFTFANSFSLKPELFANYAYELGDANSVETTLTDVAPDKATLDNYELGRNTGTFGVRIEAKKNNFSGEVGYEYKIDDFNTETRPYAKVKYVF